MPETRAPLHLKPAAELARRVILAANPHHALALAQALTEGPKMFNHHHGLWGYTGRAPDGELLSVQATGLGGGSAAVVCWELIGLGARTFVRVGEALALAPGLSLGAMLAVEEAIPGDGASAALGASSPVRADQALTALLAEAAGAATGAVVSSDLFYDLRPGWAQARAAEGCEALDLESAAVLQAATLGGARAACLLGMVATGSGRERLDREAAGALVLRAGQAAWAALLEG